MDNKEMIVYKESFISKVKKFFKNIFCVKKQKDNNSQMVLDKENQEVKLNQRKKDFLNDIKANDDEINTFYEKKKFLEQIDGNADALNMLSIDRLEKLEKYYENIIKQNEEKIKKLKKSA